MSKFGDYLHDLWHLTHPGQECDEEADVHVVTDVSLQQQMVFDAFAAPEEVGPMLGLNPVSEEVAEMEWRAHRQRMESLVPVMPLLLQQADFMGHAAAALHLDQLDGEYSEEVHEATRLVFTNIVKASLIASVATAVDMGVLKIAKEVTTDE